jgi:undecaprenyl phosphate-alpha-L-ara4N flippase subunit ArnE
MTVPIAWVLVLLAAINSTIGNLLLKKASVNEGAGLLALLFNYWFIGGVIFYAINVLLFVKAISKLPISTAYPVLACSGFLLLTLMAGFFFNEKFSSVQWIAMAMILAGLFLMIKGA